MGPIHGSRITQKITKERNVAEVDVLMITYNRPHYTKLSLERLIEASKGSDYKLWVWHNGTDTETLNLVREFLRRGEIHNFINSEENKKLRDPTNWILRNSSARFISKVDDDCLVPLGWLSTLVDVHDRVKDLGVLGCWRFLPEDFNPEAASKKLKHLYGEYQLLEHPWVEGSGFVMKRKCVEEVGVLRKNESGVTSYFTRIARKGWRNGWLFPFLWQEHMDDPRAPNSSLRTDDDMKRYLPLSALNFGVQSLLDWDKHLRASAQKLQTQPSDPRYYSPWRKRARRLGTACRKIVFRE